MCPKYHIVSSRSVNEPSHSPCSWSLVGQVEHLRRVEDLPEPADEPVAVAVARLGVDEDDERRAGQRGLHLARRRVAAAGRGRVIVVIVVLVVAHAAVPPRRGRRRRRRELDQPRRRHRGVSGWAQGALGDVAGAASRVHRGAAPQAPPILQSENRTASLVADDALC